MAPRAIHPGEHLAEELETLDMSAAELARRLKVPTNRVTAILNGQRAISGDTALRLAHFFGTTPQFWLNQQLRNDLEAAEERLGARIRRIKVRRPGVNSSRRRAKIATSRGSRCANRSRKPFT